MQDELRKLLKEELSLRDKVDAKIRSLYVRGARARYSTFSYSVVVEVIDVSHDGRVKICNLETGKMRWVDGRSRDLVWLAGPVVLWPGVASTEGASAAEQAVQR